MQAYFVSVIWTIIIHTCAARVYYSDSSYSSTSGSIIAAIVVPIAVVLAISVILCILCKMKCAQRQRRMGVSPLSTQIALAQQQNPYAPPSYNSTPPYAQPPPYGQQPPPYSAASAPTEPTEMTRTS